MKITYSHHTIMQGHHIETKEPLYQLKHWYVSNIKPDLAGARDMGIFKTAEEAIEHHKILIEEMKKSASD